MRTRSKAPGARLRVVLAGDVAIGPGQAAMLEEIGAAGSVAAAARRMGMSYKRAWYLVKSMNKGVRRPLVVMSKGGRAGGGARLTPLGDEVLRRYRRMETLTAKAINGEMAALKKALRGR